MRPVGQPRLDRLHFLGLQVHLFAPARTGLISRDGAGTRGHPDFAFSGRQLGWALIAGTPGCLRHPRKVNWASDLAQIMKGWDDLPCRVDARWPQYRSTRGQVRAPRSYFRGGSGISAFRVATSFHSPSWSVRTASKPVAGDTRFPKSTDEALKPTILTCGSLPRRSATVTRLSCGGILRLRSIRSQGASIALWIADTPWSTASHTL